MDFSFTFYIWMRWMMCFELYQNHIHSVRWLWMKIGSSRGSNTDREMFFVCIRRPKDTAYFQHHSLHAFYVNTNRDPRPRVCAVLDWDSILCPVSHCYDQKCLASDHHQMRSEPPWAQVHVSRHARSHRYCTSYQYCAQDSWNLLVSCTRNIFWFLPASNVAHSHISGHRIRHLAGHGPGPLCSHLLSTQKCCHLTHFLVTQIAAAVTQDCHSCNSILSTDKVPVSVLL